MKPLTVMLVAGETSGDMLAAELVTALHAATAADPRTATNPPRFFGAGGAHLAAAGVELAFDLTQHSVIGLWEAIKHYAKFKRLLDELVRLALERRPDVIVCVDFSGFNRRLAHAIKTRARANGSGAGGWKPKIVQYVSPQVWASRPGRATKMAEDYDLLLSIFPFEKDWYARRVPGLRVEFVGHPICDRFQTPNTELRTPNSPPLVLLLPGSRVGELKRHLPVMTAAMRQLEQTHPGIQVRLVFPNEVLKKLATEIASLNAGWHLQVSGLAEALTHADLAIASTGTVTLECAYFGVPTVAIYKTSWSTYAIGKRIIQVKYLAMPNLLADEAIYPELIQDAATPENIACAATELLAQREPIRAKLARVVASLGAPGASGRAAAAILNLLAEQPPTGR